VSSDETAELIHLSATVDAHWSPDDRGWYLYDYANNLTGSPADGNDETTWISWKDARSDFLNGEVDWSE
jgi:hypothetical protein